jgi:hypothetical protein
VASYQLYHFRGHALVGSDTIEASDDETACRIAGEVGRGQSVEIWNDHVRVGVVAPTATAPTPASRRPA